MIAKALRAVGRLGLITLEEVHVNIVILKDNIRLTTSH